MNKEIKENLDRLINTLSNDPAIKEFIELKDIINTNEELLTKINKYKAKIDNEQTDISSLKKDIYENKEFKRYKELESDIQILVFRINSVFNNSSCSCGSGIK